MEEKEKKRASAWLRLEIKSLCGIFLHLGSTLFRILNLRQPDAKGGMFRVIFCVVQARAPCVAEQTYYVTTRAKG